MQAERRTALIYDISPSLGPDVAVWPGDTPLARRLACDLARGDRTTLSSLNATSHLGAHADAPSHFDLHGRPIDEQPLHLYLGTCRVIHVSVPAGGRVMPEMLEGALGAARVLLATGTYPDSTRFNRDFAGLSPDLVDDLHRRGVRLIGIDTPSVDPFDDDEHVAHHRCAAHDIAILEGLCLQDVPEGNYELIALPLKLVGFDASPVRAVLRTLI
ncbi:MAG: cyclase family protein [Phycisphaerales bacterium]|nr:MAG: cyclase family protein [Phycisphaerales bacterium]